MHEADRPKTAFGTTEGLFQFRVMPFILDTDASDTGIGAVLSQTSSDGNERVIAYGSRLLTKPERQYCVTRRELLAVVGLGQAVGSELLAASQTSTGHTSLAGNLFCAQTMVHLPG